MNPLVMGRPMPARTPPEKGSFPLDHFKECKQVHDVYLKCLKKHKQDNLACKDISKEYLQCRMDKNLMAKEELVRLGFTDAEKTDEERRTIIKDREHEVRSGQRKQDEGFVVIKESLLSPDAWRRPSILGGSTWSFSNPFKRTSYHASCVRNICKSGFFSPTRPL